MGLEEDAVTLLEIAERVDELDCGSTIFAIEPWAPHSKAIVFLAAERGGMERTIPAEFEYMMEIVEVYEIQEWWPYELGHEPSAIELCEQMIREALKEEE